MQNIKVYVLKLSNRRFLAMQYTDPDSGKRIRRSTGTTRQRDAERAAAKDCLLAV